MSKVHMDKLATVDINGKTLNLYKITCEFDTVFIVQLCDGEKFKNYTYVNYFEGAAKKYVELIGEA